MDLPNQPLISIVIPTYNEGDDVRLSLEAAIKTDYPHKEIIVVDDSSDNTPDIIRQYEQHGVRMIKRDDRDNGCCGARNLGISEAKGDIVVLLNADVFPDRDFLRRIVSHYEKGADYLLVWQKVANDNHLFPRFVEMEGNMSYDGQDWIEWTEGFSCRRKAALEVGMIPGDFPLPFCRDWLLGKKLGEKFRKVIDRSIIVSHIAPQTFKDFWRVRKNRGRFAFLFNFFFGTVSMSKMANGEPFEKIIKNNSLMTLILRTILKTVRNILRMVIVVPVLFKSIRMAKLSPKGIRDILPFFCADIIQSTAFMAGEWSAFKDAIRCGRRNPESKMQDRRIWDMK